MLHRKHDKRTLAEVEQTLEMRLKLFKLLAPIFAVASLIIGFVIMILVLL